MVDVGVADTKGEVLPYGPRLEHHALARDLQDPQVSSDEDLANGREERVPQDLQQRVLARAMAPVHTHDAALHGGQVQTREDRLVWQVVEVHVCEHDRNQVCGVLCVQTRGFGFLRDHGPHLLGLGSPNFVQLAPELQVCWEVEAESQVPHGVEGVDNREVHCVQHGKGPGHVANDSDGRKERAEGHDLALVVPQDRRRLNHNVRAHEDLPQPRGEVLVILGALALRHLVPPERIYADLHLLVDLRPLVVVGNELVVP
mmetsp:Transcript_45739/g.146026  ORF Transcript_45739/g.146026 Transcript_45739/m.146026 type:complete len:258 (+) Transcript_45739:795-1568(+)